MGHRSSFLRPTVTVTAAVFIWVAVSGNARAQDRVSPPHLVEPVVETDEPGSLSPGAAMGLSLLGTALGYGAVIAGQRYGIRSLGYLGLAGVVLGPSAGHLYTRDHKRVWRGVGPRGLGLATMALGSYLVLKDNCFLSRDCSAGTGGAVLVLAGAAVTIGSTVYSIIDSRKSARRMNERRRRLTFTPAPVVGPDRSMGMGLALGGSF